MYPSKILLFGEYTVLINSYALAIPYLRFKGEWAFMGAESGKDGTGPILSNQRLKDFLTFSEEGLKKNLPCSLDFEAFERDLDNGQYFKSNIPEESGLGSSGAVVAAIYDKYSNIEKPDMDLIKLRNCLAEMESYYHEHSSGTDPLVSYLNLPVLIKPDEICNTFILPVEELLLKYGMFMVAFRKKGITGNLVSKFNSKCKTDTEYLRKIHMQYIPVNNECIMALTRDTNALSFLSAIRKITLLQLELFKEMIPELLIPHINYGLDNELFYLKLCGSGGGGYYLGFTKNIVKTGNYFTDNGYQILVY